MAITAEIRATYMEAWTDDLFALTMPTSEIELSRDDLLAIGSSSPTFREQFSLSRVLPLSSQVRTSIESAIREFKSGVFPRLGTCSFKQASSTNRPLTSALEVMHEMTSVNERVAAAVRNALRFEYSQSLFLREWRHIPAWSEFRVFIRDRRICGISQYHHREIFREVESQVPDIIQALIPVIRSVIAVSEQSDFVADFYVSNESIMSSELIELNPFSKNTDPALYTWDNEGDFDGCFRYRNSTGQLVRADIRSVLTLA